MRPVAPRRFGRSVFGWVLFIGLAIMLFLLLSKQGGQFKSISLDEFVARVEDKRVVSMVIDAGEITGRLSDGTEFRTAIPDGLASRWEFIHWLLDKSRGIATVRVQPTNNGVINILLPVVPWAMIFFFIWLFVVRPLRKVCQSPRPQLVITGPGRWVPDEPGKAPQA